MSANTRDTLKDIAQCLIATNNTEQQVNALENFLSLCEHSVNLRPDRSFSAFSGDTELTQGVAINPAAAAQCVRDYTRTIKFILALNNAISAQVLIQPDKPIRLLYAGCGPYATLLMPLLSLYHNVELTIHLVDVHEESLSSVQALINYFDLGMHNIHYYCENACNFQSSIPFDIIIAETMQKALEQEPQFMVTAQLSKLLSSNGVFIPEEIKVSLAIQDSHTFIRLNKPKPLLSLTSNCSFFSKLEQLISENQTHLGLQRFQIPETFVPENQQLVLQTRIQILGDIWLDEDESDISLTVPAFALETALPMQWWQAMYYFGSYPCFEFQQANI